MKCNHHECQGRECRWPTYEVWMQAVIGLLGRTPLGPYDWRRAYDNGQQPRNAVKHYRNFMQYLKA